MRLRGRVAYLLLLLILLGGGLGLPIASLAVSPSSAGSAPLVDLHTHFRGLIRSGDLVKLALEEANIEFPLALLDRAGISYRAPVEPNATSVKFRRDNFAAAELKKLESLMTVRADRPGNFDALELAYDLRRPLTNFRPDAAGYYEKLLWKIARDYQAFGVGYAELSASSEILSPEWKAVAKRALPAIEQQTGVRLRFLVGIRRTPVDQVLPFAKRLAGELGSHPYAVGVDFMGEETNATRDFADGIRAFSGLKDRNPAFQIRVHAGENAAFPDNIKDAIKAGATRIGHGVYGLDEETLRLAREADVIVELNPTSNLALGNVSSVKQGPAKRYLAAGVRLTVGTDGYGIFETTNQKEWQRLRLGGLPASSVPAIRASDSRYLISAARAPPSRDEIIAFMPGSFDPPTRAHLEIMKRALRDKGAHKLYVMVNTLNGPKDYLTSFQERAEMIRAALGSLAHRVEIIPDPAGGAPEAMEKLSKKARSLYAYIGEDAYRGSAEIPQNVFYRIIGRPGQEQAIAPHPHVERIDVPSAENISSSAARKLAAAGNFAELEKILAPSTVLTIRERALYQAPTGRPLKRARAAYKAAFRDFLASMGVRNGSGEFPVPEFNPAQSRDEWLNKFHRAWKAEALRKELAAPAELPGSGDAGMGGGALLPSCAERFESLAR